MRECLQRIMGLQSLRFRLGKCVFLACVSLEHEESLGSFPRCRIKSLKSQWGQSSRIALKTARKRPINRNHKLKCCCSRGTMHDGPCRATQSPQRKNRRNLLIWPTLQPTRLSSWQSAKNQSDLPLDSAKEVHASATTAAAFSKASPITLFTS